MKEYRTGDIVRGKPGGYFGGVLCRIVGTYTPEGEDVVRYIAKALDDNRVFVFSREEIKHDRAGRKKHEYQNIKERSKTAGVYTIRKNRQRSGRTALFIDGEHGRR